MKKPVGDYSDLEERLRQNNQRKKSFLNWKASLLGVGTAAVLGFGGMSVSEGQPNQGATQNPKEFPVKPDAVQSNDNKTAEFPLDTAAVNMPEDAYQQLDGVFYEHLNKGIGTEKKIPQGTKLGKRQGMLQEGDIPEPEFGRGSPQLEPQDYDSGVVHGGKGISTWQNEDEARVSSDKQIKDYTKISSDKEAQIDLALQMLKHFNGKDMG